MQTSVAVVVASLLVASVSSAEPKPKAPSKAPTKPVVGKDPLVLELGTAIGPFKLGMPMEQVVKLDASLKPVPGQRYSSQRWIEVGYDDKDRLSWISFHVNEYTPGVVIEGKKLVKPITSEDLQKAVPGCGAVDMREGSSLAKCQKGTEVGHAGMTVAIVLRSAP